MKFCAVICEYNPFHNGHKYLLDEMRKRSGCDGILCLMSGDFTQRGDMTVFGKFDRARHAVENGADAVIELPAAFAVSPAEIFAAGAVKLLHSLPAVTALAFGCESGGKEDFLRAAKATVSEDKTFKTLLKQNMKDGTSYAKALTMTALALHPDLDETLFTSPNNLLGVEYARAILAQGAKLDLFPIPRIGGGFADKTLFKDFSSATAIRAALKSDDKKTRKLLKGNLPDGVYRDADRAVRDDEFKKAAMCALLARDPEEILKCPDCSEGLENKLRAMIKSNPDYRDMLDKSVSKRYTLSRLKRILLQNFLGIERKAVRSYLEAPLYINALAVQKKNRSEILGALSEGAFPLLARKSDAGVLKREALACFETDVRAAELYNILSGTFVNPNETLFV